VTAPDEWPFMIEIFHLEYDSDQPVSLAVADRRYSKRREKFKIHPGDPRQ